MAEVTIQILDGMERGRVCAGLETPFTIGREDDNAIQLNDERVSRFHLKIQEDAGKVILTDLESTNGTRVNAVPTQLRVLQIGDLISLGRCLLVYGSPEEIAERFRSVYPSPLSPLQNILADPEASSQVSSEYVPEIGATFQDGSDLSSDWSERVDLASQQMAMLPPPIPESFRLVQQAQLVDLVTFIQQQIQIVLQQSQETNEGSNSTARLLPGPAFRHLIELEMTLARILQQIGNPNA